MNPDPFKIHDTMNVAEIVLVPYPYNAPALSYDFSSFDIDDLRLYIEQSEIGGSLATPVLYTHTGLTADVVTDAYSGMVYSPSQNVGFNVPYNTGTNAQWQVVDFVTGTTVGYTNGATTVANAYQGGCFSPTQNRIYFAPYGQSANATWHYVNCSSAITAAGTNMIGSYTGPVLAANAYWGAVQAPVQNRIYFVPYVQANTGTWHYIDGSTTGTPATTSYTTLLPAGEFAAAGAYRGGVYSPRNDRIYLVPSAAQCLLPWWHYIDCASGTVVHYSNPYTVAAGQGYSGGAYFAEQDRIYFAPNEAGTGATLWTYIVCGSSTVVQYAKPTGATAYNSFGAVFSPVDNRVYFLPGDTATATGVYFMDGSAGGYVAYGLGDQGAYSGGVYAPVENRIYLSAGDTTAGNWLAIDLQSNNPTSKTTMGGALYNKT